ncbi:MAG: tetratricopeptide repeat protein [Roseiflexaceae bacterium]
MLLILDNFEHLLAGVDLVSTILGRAPHLTVLVTSRERLNLQAEWLFDVDGLAFPAEDPHGSTTSQSLADLADYSAVQLFLQRVRQVKLGWALDETTLMAMVRICQHVAGMPLAIELAAAGGRTLPLAEIERQIGANLDVFATTLRDVPARHRSMRAVFDYSWNLLSEPERTLFRRLAVFRGGWTLTAAEQVARATLAALMALVDKSLLRREERYNQSFEQPGAVEPRFVMLEPLRDYALERLLASADAEDIRQRHARYFITQAEAAAAWDTPAINVAIAWQRRELDNLRAALQWACETSASILALRLAVALEAFWINYGGYNMEGRAWLGQVLKLEPHPTDTTIRAMRRRALQLAARLASDQQDYAVATRLFEEALTLSRILGDTGGETDLLITAARQARRDGQYKRAMALLEDALSRHRRLNERASSSTIALGLIAEFGQVLRELALMVREQGDFTRATALFEECVELYRASGDRVSTALATLGLGDVARDLGNAEGVVAYCTPSLAVFRESDMHWAIGFALNNLALAAFLEGDLIQARALVGESVSLFRGLKDDVAIAEVLVTQGHIFMAQDDAAAACRAFVEALRLTMVAGRQLLVAAAMEGLANVVVSQGDAELGVRLLASASALRAQMSTPVRPVDQAMVDHALATARSMLGDTTFAAVWAEAQALPVEQILSGLPSFAALTAEGLAATKRDTPADFPPLRLAGERAVDEPPLILPPFLSAAPSQPGPPALFVAREQELAELAAVLTAARGGAGQILFVIGGAGRGKTMLVQEFARQAQAADAEVLVVSGSCNAHTGTGDPYLPFCEALTMLCGDVEARWAGGLITAEHAHRLWEAMPLTLPALIEHAPTWSARLCRVKACVSEPRPLPSVMRHGSTGSRR